MQVKTQTDVHALKDGDRFYKVGDKDKRVFQVALASMRADGYAMCVQDGANPKYPVSVKSNIEVIFLRHTQWKIRIKR